MESAMEKVIENNKLYLRKIEYSDTDYIIKWRNSDSVRKNFIYQALFTRESHEKWLKTMVEPGIVDQLIICMKNDGLNNEAVPIGSVYIRDIDRNHGKAEYGIFIGDESVRGKGIGSMTAELMIEYCFKYLKLHRLFLRVFADNIQAIRSYEKAGFRFEAFLKDDVKIDGKYRDIILMGILNPDSE